MKNIIFHHPLPLNYNATSASGIRPVRMLEAFKNLGYNVDLVVGYGKERKKAIKGIQEEIRQGKRYEFVYSESSTMPTLLTEPNHLPFYPCLDFSFFKFLKNQGIPIGLFYRDIYWLFDNYDSNLSPFKARVAKFFYKYDLKKYKKSLTRLYLPSLKMGEYIPAISSDLFRALPPGHIGEDCVEQTLQSKLEKKAQIELLYIGGLSNHYQMHKLFSALSHFKLHEVKFTLCTREQEWNQVKKEYCLSLPENIEVVHKSGAELIPLFNRADIAMLFVKPQKYRQFAAPVKLYEYLGEKKPIIATCGTLAGQFVESNKIGWTIPYDEQALIELLTELLSDVSLLDKAKANMLMVADQHTWLARAKYVVDDLQGGV